MDVNSLLVGLLCLNSSDRISLGWKNRIVVYSPQIIENYQLKSGEGLSVFFVLIWLAGDLTNLFGAMLAGLLPTIIILAVYVSTSLLPRGFDVTLISLPCSQYSACDIILLIQIYYYRWIRPHEPSASSITPEAEVSGRIAITSEETPLIAERRDQTVSEKLERSILGQCLVYGGALLFVLGTGVAAWAVDEYLHRERPRQPPKEVFEWRSQVLGWISAVMYREFRLYISRKEAH